MDGSSRVQQPLTDGRARGGYPRRADHDRAWAALAAEIAARPVPSEAAPSAAPAHPGELTIIGSGIESLGFVRGDEALIEDADVLLYCVADPATVIWLKDLRPDALDLYVLYDDRKPRYHTYMQMAEAMLAPVRAGRRVTAVFYGHPGIFVLATHRAVRIARREGHRAVMRPGVSALDCLCADLGVDPAHPGMQTFEATDLLIRRRRPDPTLHLVLWQVGLIGELGFRRRGYLNSGFSLFVDYLQGVYGADYPVTNYIAARYPGLAPVADTYTLAALHEPNVQARVTGISTFYLAPRNTAPVDRALMRRLGMLKPGQAVRTPDSPLRKIDRYGPRERAALAGLAGFRPPRDYHWQRDTAAGRLLIALREDPDLRRRFAADPAAAVAAWPGLDTTARRRMATGEAGAMQLAAKDPPTPHAGNQRLLGALFARRDRLAGLRRLIAHSSPAERAGNLAAWSAGQGFSADWARLADDIALAERRRLWAWAGLYAADAGPIVVIHAVGEVRRLWIGPTAVPDFSYRDGTLRWPAQRAVDGSSIAAGQLRTDRDRAGRRRLVGRLSSQGDAAVLRERLPPTRHPSAYAGCWRDGAGRVLEIEPVDGPAGRVLELRLDDRPLPGPYRCDGDLLIVGNRRLAMTGAADSAAWQALDDPPPALLGDYALPAPLPPLRLAADGLWLGGQRPARQQLGRNRLHWSEGPPGARAGALALLLDPLTLDPLLTGWIEPEPGRRIHRTARRPTPADLRRPEPELGLCTAQWAELLTLAIASDGLDWLRWQKAAAAERFIHRRLADAIADVEEDA